jgi:hypothetical protein
MNILPRQARDKHRKVARNSGVFFVQWASPTASRWLGRLVIAPGLLRMGLA